MTPEMLDIPIRALGLSISGSPLEPVVAAFLAEIEPRGLLTPVVHCSASWCASATTIGVPFWLADHDLTALHADRRGAVEGVDAAEVTRHLRHEYAHCVQYAYGLEEQAGWRRIFGNPSAAPVAGVDPCSRDHCRYLPGNVAQTSPGEDWAETMATWIDPGLKALIRYAGWAGATTKLFFCGQVLRGLRWTVLAPAPPTPVGDVGGLGMSVNEFYAVRP